MLWLLQVLGMFAACVVVVSALSFGALAPGEGFSLSEKRAVRCAVINAGVNV